MKMATAMATMTMTMATMMIDDNDVYDDDYYGVDNVVQRTWRWGFLADPLGGRDSVY